MYVYILSVCPFSEQFTNKHKEKADNILVGGLGLIAILFILYMVSLGSPKEDDSNYPVNVTDSTIEVEEIADEYPDFRHSIILRDKGRGTKSFYNSASSVEFNSF